MSTQQDIYAGGSENRPPMLNKENYVPWSSCLIRYAKGRPNGKLIHNSIINGPYVRRMIHEPGDPNREVLVNETFHVQTDDELTKKELKQIEADDQAIQTILFGLLEDIYAAVDSCETAQEIWLRVQQMMKGSDIGIQEKKSKLFNKWKRFTSIDGESMKWSRHITILHQTKDLHTADYTQLYDFLKYNQKEVDDLKAERLAKIQDPLAPIATSNNPYTFPNVENQVIQNAVQNPRTQNVGNQNGLIGVPGNANQNPNGNGNLVAARAESNVTGHNGIQLQAKEFDLMVDVADLDEIEEVNTNCILMANLQQASTSGTQTDKALVYDSDRSAEHKALELEIERLLRAVVSQDIMSVVQNNSVGETSDLQIKLERVDNTKTRRPQPRSNTKNDMVPSASKSSRSKNKEVEVEEHHRKLPLSRDKKHMSPECNNVKLATPNGKSKVICAMCKQCLISVNHDKQKPKVKKTKKVGSIKRLALPKPSKPRSFLRWSPAGRFFDLKGKIIASSESESQSDYSKGDNACTSNPLEPTIKRFPNSTFSLAGIVRFENDHVDAILGFDDLQWGNILITRVYFIEGLGHNLLIGRAVISKDEALKVIKTFLKRIIVLLQSPVIIIRTDNGTEFKNQVLKEYFDSVGISHQVSLVRISQQNRVVERRNRTLVEAARTMLIFSRASLFLWAEAIATACFTQNRFIIHHIGKLGAKGDIGFFIGYSADSCAYRVYNRRTKKIMETMHVTFDELLAMDFEQRSSKSRLQSMTSGQISSGLDLTYAPSIITTQQRTEGELDLLFEAMYDDFIGGQPSTASRTVLAAQAHQVRQTPMISTSIADTVPTPTNSFSQAKNFLNTSQNVDKLTSQQQHAQQQGNQALIQPETIADNVTNAMFDANTFVNPFATPSTSAAESSSSQYVDSSNMHTNQLRSDGDMCIHALTVSTMEPKNVKEAMTDPVWIESMQEELLQFKRLDVWVLVPAPDNITPFSLKWLFKNKHDEEKRIFLACVAHISFIVFQMDMKTAFLHGTLKKDVYVCQPEGFIDADHPSHVFTLKKALYGLKQAPHAWYDELSTFLLHNHFYKGTIDLTLFIRRFDDDILVVQVYVDDIIFGSTHPRPNIVHATCLCARCQAKPTEKHLNEVKRIFRYLRGTVNTGLCTFGGTRFLGEKLVSWSSKKQDCTALSTAEAQYVSLSACNAQVLWMRTQLTDYGFHFNKIPIYCDSKSAIAISCNPV
nr:hypothetical protein [Tanacetum cinerariifolium]